mgnify:CR=1 FL=1
MLHEMLRLILDRIKWLWNPAVDLKNPTQEYQKVATYYLKL